jgi:hypothetical protein
MKQRNFLGNGQCGYKPGAEEGLYISNSINDACHEALIPKVN